MIRRPFNCKRLRSLERCDDPSTFPFTKTNTRCPTLTMIRKNNPPNSFHNFFSSPPPSRLSRIPQPLTTIILKPTPDSSFEKSVYSQNSYTIPFFFVRKFLPIYIDHIISRHHHAGGNMYTSP